MFGYVVAYTSKLITTQEREAKTELVTQTILHILVLQTLGRGSFDLAAHEGHVPLDVYIYMVCH